jgi:dATP pyrophosphohydrolase
MPKIKSNRIAVYVYRKTPAGPEFLQLLRAPGQGDYGGIWSIVYGGIKSGETAVEAALRELREETGLKPTAFHQVEFLEMFYHRGRDRVNVLPVFAAAAPRNHKVVLNDEHSDFRWVPSADVEKSFLWRVQRQAIAIITEDIVSARSLTLNLLKIQPD